MVDAAAIAAGMAAGAILLTTVSILCFYHIRSHKPYSTIAAVWRRHPPKFRRDLEKGHPTARVSDEPNPQHPPRTDVSPSSPSVQTFTWNEIQTMTENFSTAVIGEGGYSRVYLAHVDGAATSAAVKVHTGGGGSERLHRAFRRELELLLHLRHPHIVQLLGYSNEQEEGALVLEFVPNGTLHEKLHEKPDYVLPWKARTKIAHQVAEAVEHLHDFCDLPIIHCDLKSSNVLLDQNLDAKLCDFGSALAGFEPTISPNSMMGSPGYVDPHYLRTGLVSKKGDIYSFGVLLLELLTGGEAFCSEKEQILAVSVGEALRGEAVEEIVDRRLGGEYERDMAAEIAALAALAARCIEEQPSSRPSMGEVVSSLACMRNEKP